jgi:hypothetical protein
MKSVFRDYLIAREKDLLKARSIQGLQPEQIPSDLQPYNAVGSGIPHCTCKPCKFCKSGSAAPAAPTAEIAVAPEVLEIVAAVKKARKPRKPSAWGALVSRLMKEKGLKMVDAAKLGKQMRAEGLA